MLVVALEPWTIFSRTNSPDIFYKSIGSTAGPSPLSGALPAKSRRDGFVAKMRLSFEIERLEARQLPDASLATAGLDLVVVPRNQLVAQADSQQEQPQPTPADAIATVAALWQTPSSAANTPPGQPLHQSASSVDSSNT